MAHGFLTPEPVSGDNFWKNAKDLWNMLQKLKKRKAPPDEVVPAIVAELQKALPPAKQKLLSPASQKLLSGKNQAALSGAKAPNMLTGSPVSKMLSSGKSEITIKQQLSLPPGGPRLPPSGGMPNEPSAANKGGSFIDMPGVSAAPKKLDSEAFFKAAQTGVHPETGRYLNSEERKDFLKKSQTKMDAPASVASAGITSASTSVTKGDEKIVKSVEDLTKVVVSLVDAVKAQTSAQIKAANAQKASTERTANRALAAAEESSLEQSTDLSGTTTPIGGIGSMTPGAGAGGGGGGGLLGKAAQAVTKRGLGRALPRIGASVAGKTGARAGAQATAKIGTNVAAKTGAKAAARLIPGVQTALGVGFAMDSFSKGDVLGGLLNLGSAIPGPLGWAFLGGSVANDLSKGGSAEVAPFEKGGIITQPTLSVMGEGRKKEGVFPLEGAAGKKTFEQFGQGIFEAQRKNKREYASIQSAGLRQYYENEDGFKKMGEGLKKFFEGLAGGLAALLGGSPANAAEFNPAADYLADPAVTGDEKEYLMRLMIAEAGGQGDIGMAAVGRSVLNRAGLIQGGHLGAGQFNAASGSVMDVINASGQYQPVAQGKLKRALSPEERKRAEAALAIAMNQSDMRGRLEAKGMKGDQINKIMAATGFRAGSAFNDPSQNVNVTKLGDHYFNTAGNRGLLTPGSVKMSEGSFTPAAGGGNSSIASAAQSLKGMDTSSGPGGGSVSCVYAVNKVFAKAGVKPPWGGAQSTDAVINGAKKAGWQQVGFNDAKPGDLWAYDANDGKKGHVGIMMPNGKVLSNSSSRKQFIWEADRGALLREYPKAGMTPPGGIFFRAPGGGGADVARKPPAKPTPATATVTPQRNRRGQGSTSGTLQASAATPPTGVQLAQASNADAVSQRRNTRGGGTTIINNNNNVSGSGTQVASADPAGGSNSMGLGALAIRLAS